MRIYRAMCKEEMLHTVKYKRPYFRTRFKWFSHNLDWIHSKVCGGEFNNSQYMPLRYEFILEFEWDETRHDFKSTNEIQFNIRKNPKIHFIGVVR